MRRLVITENFGQYVIETSTGARAAGATLESALKKLIPATHAELFFDFEPVRVLFDAIPEVQGASQIARGQAAG
jgi:hypothetical protein